MRFRIMVLELKTNCLFNDLEMYNRKPPDKVVVKKVADAYELLGLQDEQEKVLERYQSLFRSSLKSRSKKVREMLEDGDDKNTGEDKQEVAGNSPRDSAKPLESIPTNGDASCDSNGPASATLLSPSTAVEERWLMSSGQAFTVLDASALHLSMRINFSVYLSSECCHKACILPWCFGNAEMRIGLGGVSYKILLLDAFLE
eukprot:Gb_00067 [translate_table: standard]